MSAEGLKITACFGERDRVDGRFLAERIVAELDGAGMRAAILMRGVEGFGSKHQLRTDRLLTLSEDLPVVVVGVGEAGPGATASKGIEGLPFAGLVTAERVLLADRGAGAPEADDRTKLSAYLGRGRRVGGRPAHEWLVERLREAGADGAGVLLGVDGILGGLRRRASFFSGNADVPALVVAVGEPGALAAVAGDLEALQDDALVTLERAHVCKRDGGPLRPPPGRPPNEGPAWRKLTLFASERDRAAARPVHVEAVRRLREAGAAGATALRGAWGFDGSREPHGDSLRSLRRRVPTVTVVVDERDRCEHWLEILDELTPERGLITAEEVPSLRSGRGVQSSPAGTS